ncbi:unnamed protein product, partial [Brassica oleracea var. botrytis]
MLQLVNNSSKFKIYIRFQMKRRFTLALTMGSDELGDRLYSGASCFLTIS